MRSFKKLMRSISKFFSKKNLRKVATRAARVAQEVTKGQVVVTKDDDILLDESTTRLVVRKIASVALASVGIALVVIPTNFKFTMEIGDRLIRIATTMWDGEQWTQTALI
jgi:hypothetical protein